MSFTINYNNIFQIDSVGLPTWQAQLSGTKTWTLIPLPECEHKCDSINITVEQGDISKFFW